MKRLNINGEFKNCYHLDLWEKADALLWSKIVATDRNGRTEVRMGTMEVINLPKVGRAVRNVTHPESLLFEPFLSLGEWLAFSEEEPAVGTHLFTKDGRVIGNAIITERKVDIPSAQWAYETDFGNTGVSTLAELQSRWHFVRNDEVQVTSVEEWRNDRKELLRTIGPPKEAEIHDPQRCPYCSGDNVQYITGIQTMVTNAEDSSASGRGLDLDEWQCRGDCAGRSFWV
jgi:hypothetical protein